jgi:DNA-directed RNA polymerase subunit beta'
MALELFKPFVIHKIISRGLAYNVKQANRLIEQGIPEVWAILEEVISSRRVLLNRAPTLHRLGIQAFKPVLIEDLCIRIPPLVCTAFNADFDGDQMGVHLPLTTEAQYEAKEIMDASLNLLKPADGSPVVTPTNDVILGIYWLTYTKKPQNEEKRKTFANVAELALAFEKGLISEQDEVEVFIDGNKYITSYGRVLFNEILPPDFSFVNEVLDKGKLKSLVGKIIERYDAKTSSYYIDKIKELGFKYSTLSSITWGIKDTVLVKEKKAIIEEAEKEVEMIESEYDEGLLTFEERKTRIIDVWMKVRDKISKILPSVFDEKNPLFYIVHSKSRGSWTQVAQMVGMKGLVQDVRGEPLELPVKSSYKEGLNVLEYFIGIHGSRKGLVDTALKTAAAGYLTRRMVDVVQDIFIQEEDCGSNEGIRIVKKEGDAYGFSFAERIFSRTLLEDVKVGSQVIAKKGEIITRELARKIEEANVPEIKVRSPITCKTEGGICATCYGLDLGRNKKVEIGETVGVIAAQSIGEPGTQLTLRTFHIGGVAGADITHGLPRVEEIFEARTPKGKAPIVKADGVVVDIVEKGLITSVLVKEDVPSKKKSSKRKKEQNITEYLVPPKGILKVKVGDVVKKGDQICEGSLDLREILAYRGLEELIHYIINEIQSIYVLQGSIINDKHIEIIIRKMLSKVVIKEKGDSEFIEGEIVDKERFKKVALKLLKAKKKPPKAAQKIMGITRVALSTESFLSAASFQETSRVLVEAAVSGKVDELKGLKENVIIGRLIPAGTGKRPIPKDELEKLEKELTGENNFGSLEDEKKE